MDGINLDTAKRGAGSPVGANLGLRRQDSEEVHHYFSLPFDKPTLKAAETSDTYHRFSPAWHLLISCDEMS